MGCPVIVFAIFGGAAIVGALYVRRGLRRLTEETKAQTKELRAVTLSYAAALLEESRKDEGA